MNKNIFITLVLLSFLGCIEKEPTPKISLKEPTDVNTSKVKPKLSLDFVPEHIKRSKIEVIKHY